jgi:hypothetical protein
MFEVRCWWGVFPWIVLPALLLGPDPGTVGAQEAPDSVLREVRHRVDSLVVRSRALAARADSAEHLRRMLEFEARQIPVDTFSWKSFHLVATPDQRELAETSFARAWAEVEPLAAGSESLFQPWTFLVFYYWSDHGMLLAGDSLFVKIGMSRRYPLRYLEEKIARTLGEVLMRSVPAEISTWAGGALRASSGDLPWVAREIITGASTAIRRCYEGDLGGCAQATGLRGGEDPWGNWFTPPERRIYVERRVRLADAAGSALWDGCVRAGMDEACRVILQGRPLDAPLTPRARASLLGQALEIGGAGAFRRLRETGEGDLARHLEAAAGVPLDTLLASWRSKVLATRTSAWAGLDRSPFTLFLWILLFGALASRSTRWRLG